MPSATSIATTPPAPSFQSIQPLTSYFTISSASGAYWRQPLSRIPTLCLRYLLSGLLAAAGLNRNLRPSPGFYVLSFKSAEHCIVPVPNDSRPVVNLSCCGLWRNASLSGIRSAALGYGVAVLSPFAVVAIRFLLDPLLGDHLPFAPFVIAVVVTSWVGGWKPALLAFCISLAAAVYLFMPPRWSLRGDLVEHQVELVLYFFVGITLIPLFESLRKARQRAEDALANVKRLQSLLPICAWCKKIRDDKNYWHQVESYIADHTGAKFTHGICPTCLKGMEYPDAEDRSA
jgi:hypothetical protein